MLAIEVQGDPPVDAGACWDISPTLCRRHAGRSLDRHGQRIFGLRPPLQSPAWFFRSMAKG